MKHEGIADVEQIRTFVAVFPSEEILVRLHEAQRQLAKSISHEAVRWTKPQQIHLTLAFLGSVDVRKIPDFESAIASVALEISSFQLNVESVGCFPNERRPRIVWAGLSGDLNSLRT